MLVIFWPLSSIFVQFLFFPNIAFDPEDPDFIQNNPYRVRYQYKKKPLFVFADANAVDNSKKDDSNSENVVDYVTGLASKVTDILP